MVPTETGRARKKPRRRLAKSPGNMVAPSTAEKVSTKARNKLTTRMVWDSVMGVPEMRLSQGSPTPISAT